MDLHRGAVRAVGAPLVRWYGRGRPAVTQRFGIVVVGLWHFVYNSPESVDSWADEILRAMREE